LYPLSTAIALDASWLLPALLGAALGLVAILIAQAVTGSSAEVVASTRRVATVASLLVGAAAVTVAVFSLVALFDPAAPPASLFATLVLVGIILFLALWMSVLFFGAPSVQLEVAEEILRQTCATDEHMGKPVRAWWKGVLANTVAFMVFGVLGYFLSSALSGSPVPNPAGAAAVWAVITVYLVGTAFVSEAMLVESGVLARWLVRLAVLFVFLGPILVGAVSLLTLDLYPAAIALIATTAIAVCSAWVSSPSQFGGWTIRASVNAWSKRRLAKRLALTKTFITELRRTTTSLHLP